MSERLERLLSGVLVVAALLIAGSMVHREFFSSAKGVSGAPQPGAAPTFMASWKDALPIGESIGDVNAPVKVVVLSDLECPFCSRFHMVMKPILEKRGSEVELVFVHHPLGIHRFALPAARAAECASAFGKFPEFVDAVYRKQDSLGIKSWGSFAADAGVSDTSRVVACIAASKPISRIEAGTAYATKIGSMATPTVIINGWRFSNPPTAVQINDVLDSLKKGVRPFSVAGKSL